MAKTVQWVIDACEDIVSDDGTRWGDAWLDFINVAQLSIAQKYPTATVKEDDVKLSPGAVQRCPDDAMAFNKLICNMGSDGTTVGKAILPCDEFALSSFNPSWMTEESGAEIFNYMPSQEDPTQYKVYPPASDTQDVYVKLEYRTVPAKCLNFSDTLSIADEFLPELVEMVAKMALSSETEAKRM